MHFSCNYPPKRNGALPTFLILLLVFSSIVVVQGACGKKEQTEPQTSKPAATVRKPMPIPRIVPDGPEPIAETEEMQPAPAQPPLSESSMPPREEPKEKPGRYTVQKGDTLSKISGLGTVYDDPDMWTSLFQLNQEKLSWMKTAEDVEEKELAPGVELKFLTDQEISDNRTRLGARVYAINVLSAETPEKIVPQAILLLKKGYDGYVTSALVDGKKWLRLRVGFFMTYSEAVAARERIASFLIGSRPWITKISESEKTRFGGYMEKE